MEGIDKREEPGMSEGVALVLLLLSLLLELGAASIVSMTSCLELPVSEKGGGSIMCQSRNLVYMLYIYECVYMYIRQ